MKVGVHHLDLFGIRKMVTLATHENVQTSDSLGDFDRTPQIILSLNFGAAINI